MLTEEQKERLRRRFRDEQRAILELRLKRVAEWQQRPQEPEHILKRRLHTSPSYVAPGSGVLPSATRKRNVVTAKQMYGVDRVR